MRVLLAFDKFKGSLSAHEVCSSVAEGIKTVHPEAECIPKPIADGGEGFVNALVQVMHGEIMTVEVEDALGNLVEAEWGLIPDEGGYAAVIEMSAASGLWRIAPEQRDIMSASSYGTGQLIKVASQQPGVNKIYLGLGGSATNDAGLGMLQALGATFDGIDEGQRVCPNLIPHIRKINPDGVVSLPPIVVACDVENPLLGDKGASAVFGPQKGATPELVESLDRLLSDVVILSERSECASLPGAGAAGGMGFGLVAFLEAQLVSGFKLVAEAIGLESVMEQCDLVITGEGKIDEQSLDGKGPIGVANLAKQQGKRCYAVAGAMSSEVDWTPYFDGQQTLMETGVPLSELMEDGQKYLVHVARDLARAF